MPNDTIGIKLDPNSLGTEFWYTGDIETLQSEFQKPRSENPGQKRPPADQIDRISSRDPTIFSLAAGGAVTPRADQILNEAKYFGQRVANRSSEPASEDEITRRAHRLVLCGGGGGEEDPQLEGPRAFDTFVRSIAQMIVGQEGFQASGLQDTGDLLSDVRSMARTMLNHPDFVQALGAENMQPDDAAALRLSFVNAVLGALKLKKEGRLTEDSALAIMQGKVIDMAHGASVLKLTHDEAARLYADFVGAKDITDQIDGSVLGNMDNHAKQALADIKAGREKMMRDFKAVLERSVDLRNEDAVRDQILNLANAMRSFRYRLDQRFDSVGNGSVFKWVRRKLDNLVSDNIFHFTDKDVQGGTIDLAQGELDKIAILNERGGVRVNSLFGGEPQCKELRAKLTEATHAANDRVRQFIAGHERKLDSFADQARSLYDSLAKGGSRTIKLEVEGKASLGTGPKDKFGVGVRFGGRYARTATVSVVNGEIVLSTKWQVAGFAEVGATLGTVGAVDADANAGASADIGKVYQRKFRSVDDFIAAMKGKCELVDGVVASHVPFMLGKIGRFMKGVASGVHTGLVKMGVLHDNYKEDNQTFRKRLVDNSVISNMDRMLANWSGPGLVAVETEAWNGGVEGRVGGRLTTGSKEKPDMKFEASLGEEVRHTGKGTGATYSTVVDEMMQMPANSLRLLQENIARTAENSDIGDYKAVSVPTDVAGCKKEIRAVLDKFDAFELKWTPKSRQNGWKDDMKREYDMLVARFAFAAKTWQNQVGIPESQKEFEKAFKTASDRLMRPEISMDEADFREIFQRKIYNSSARGTTYTVNGTFEWDPLGSLPAGTDPLGKSGWSTLGVSGKIDFTYTRSNPAPGAENDARPWARGVKEDYAFKFSAAAPLRAIFTKVAEYLKDKDEHGYAQAFKDASTNFLADLARVAGTNAVKAAKDFSLAQLAELAKGNKGLAKFLKHSPFDFGLELGFDMIPQMELKLHIEYDRLTSISVSNVNTTVSSIGASLPVFGAKSGIGFSMSNTFVDGRTLVNRMYDVAPETLLAVADRCLDQGGDVTMLKLLMSSNSTAAARLYDVYSASDGPRPARDAEDGRNMARIVDEAWKQLVMIRDNPESTPVRRERARGIMDRLQKALALGEEGVPNLGTRFARLDENQKSVKVDVLAGLLVPLAQACRLAKECGLQKESRFNDPLPVNIPDNADWVIPVKTLAGSQPGAVQVDTSARNVREFMMNEFGVVAKEFGLSEDIYTRLSSKSYGILDQNSREVDAYYTVQMNFLETLLDQEKKKVLDKTDYEIAQMSGAAGYRAINEFRTALLEQLVKNRIESYARLSGRVSDKIEQYLQNVKAEKIAGVIRDSLKNRLFPVVPLRSGEFRERLRQVVETLNERIEETIVSADLHRNAESVRLDVNLHNASKDNRITILNEESSNTQPLTNSSMNDVRQQVQEDDIIDIAQFVSLGEDVRMDQGVAKQTRGGQTCFFLSIVNGLQLSEAGRVFLREFMNGGEEQRFHFSQNPNPPEEGTELPKVPNPETGNYSRFEMAMLEEYRKWDDVYQGQIKENPTQPVAGDNALAAQMMGLRHLSGLDVQLKKGETKLGANWVRDINGVIARGGVVTLNIGSGGGSHFVTVTHVEENTISYVDSSGESRVDARSIADLTARGAVSFTALELPLSKIADVTMDSVVDFIHAEFDTLSQMTEFLEEPRMNAGEFGKDFNPVPGDVSGTITGFREKIVEWMLGQVVKEHLTAHSVREEKQVEVGGYIMDFVKGKMRESGKELLLQTPLESDAFRGRLAVIKRKLKKEVEDDSGITNLVALAGPQENR